MIHNSLGNLYFQAKNYCRLSRCIRYSEVRYSEVCYFDPHCSEDFKTFRILKGQFLDLHYTTGSHTKFVYFKP